MKAKLKFDRNEMKGFLTLVQNLNNAMTGESFVGMMYQDALRGLLLKLAKKMPSMQKQCTLTLTEMETLSVRQVLCDWVDRMMPYEMALGYRILEAMDKQHQERNRLLNANISGSETMLIGQ